RHRLRPAMVERTGYGKGRGARIWPNPKGSIFGPLPKQRRKLERIIAAGIDLIEFSMDAGDAETYATVRPPHGGPPRHPEEWWAGPVENVPTALQLRQALRATAR